MRRLTKMLISGTLIASMGLTAGAATFGLAIMNPYSSSLTSTVYTSVATSTPYVSPSVASPPTSYFLSAEPKSIYNATEIISNLTTPGRRYFTYRPGYGGANTSYYLSAFPAISSFNDYTVEGTWSA